MFPFIPGERVDVHVQRMVGGEWVFVCSHLTDKGGRVAVTLSDQDALPIGMHPVKIVVR